MLAADADQPVDRRHRRDRARRVRRRARRGARFRACRRSRATMCRGFIILLDRSLRLGDTINVRGLSGHASRRSARVTPVVRGLDGIETLIPNEKLITDVVQNYSSYLTRGNAKVAVQVSLPPRSLNRRWQLLRRGDAGTSPTRARRTRRPRRCLDEFRHRRHQSGAGFLDRRCGERGPAA